MEQKYGRGIHFLWFLYVFISWRREGFKNLYSRLILTACLSSNHCKILEKFILTLTQLEELYRKKCWSPDTLTPSSPLDYAVLTTEQTIFRHFQASYRVFRGNWKKYALIAQTIMLLCQCNWLLIWNSSCSYLHLIVHFVYNILPSSAQAPV